jgi:hypothetical protein
MYFLALSRILAIIRSTDTGVSTPEPSAPIVLVGGLLAVGLTVLPFKPNFGVSASQSNKNLSLAVSATALVAIYLPR